VDRETVAVYEGAAVHYRDRRRAYAADAAAAFAASVPAGALRADLGCGPGHYGPHLGRPLLSVDAAHAMVREVPGPLRVQADLVDLPLVDGCLHGAWASKCYQHLPHEALPAALAELQRVTVVGAPVVLTMFSGEGTRITDGDDDLPGRLFSLWTPDRLVDVVTGAGFEVLAVEDSHGGWPQVRVVARRARSLADHVGPGMRLLLCGLNPSLYSADRGVNYARPGNRFWPAMLEAGLATVDRDPRHLLRHHAIGTTDLVKRATVAADELSTDEYAAGVARVERLCAWLRPGALYLVGLAGWRAAVDRKAKAGWQPEPLGGVPVYVGPSTSGLNASTQLPGHIAHLRAATGLS
jgi:TDG/mug DNA glycosylase family protein